MRISIDMLVLLCQGSVRSGAYWVNPASGAGLPGGQVKTISSSVTAASTMRKDRTSASCDRVETSR